MKKLLKGCCGCLGIIFGFLLIVFLGFYVYYEWIWEEWSPARIERITGVRIPKYEIVDYNNGERGFIGDYMDDFTFEFKSMPSEELFDEIDKMILTGNTGWKKEDNRYSFSVMWGNGIPAPKGEKEEDDGIFGITITKGEKTGEIRSGAW